MVCLLCSPGAIEAGCLPAGVVEELGNRIVVVVEELGNRIVVVVAELAADMKLERSAGFS